MRDGKPIQCVTDGLCAIEAGAGVLQVFESRKPMQIAGDREQSAATLIRWQRTGKKNAEKLFRSPALIDDRRAVLRLKGGTQSP